MVHMLLSFAPVHLNLAAALGIATCGLRSVTNGEGAGLLSGCGHHQSLSHACTTHLPEWSPLFYGTHSEQEPGRTQAALCPDRVLHDTLAWFCLCHKPLPFAASRPALLLALSTPHCPILQCPTSRHFKVRMLSLSQAMSPGWRDWGSHCALLHRHLPFRATGSTTLSPCQCNLTMAGSLTGGQFGIWLAWKFWVMESSPL